MCVGHFLLIRLLCPRHTQDANYTKNNKHKNNNCVSSPLLTQVSYYLHFRFAKDVKLV